MDEYLNDDQLETLMCNGPLFDEIEPSLQEPLRNELTDLQIRTGNAYNAGSWTIPATGEKFVNPPYDNPPTREQVQKILGEVYLALDSNNKNKQELKDMMDSLCLTPSAPKSAKNHKNLG